MLEEDQDYAHEPSFCHIKTEQPSESHETGIWTLHLMEQIQEKVMEPEYY